MAPIPQRKAAESSSVALLVLPGFVAVASVILVRLLYNVLLFPYLATEDDYQLVIFGNTIYETGALNNPFAALEPRVQNSPPLIPVLLAGLLLFAEGQGVLGMHLFAFVGQVVTVYFIFRILHTIGIRYSFAIVGSLAPLAFSRFVSVTSLSAPDSLLVGLGAASGWLFLMSLKERHQRMYLFANFAILVTLAWLHNFGILLAGISLLSYLLVLLLDFNRTFLMYILIGSAAWAVLVLPRFVFVLTVYGTGVAFGISDPSVLAGVPFLESLRSYYGYIPLLLLVPLGGLFVMTFRKRMKGVVLFPLWLVLNITILAIIPRAFSHFSRYPLQFIVPLSVLVVLGLLGIGGTISRLNLTAGLRRFRKHLAVSIVLLLLIPVLFVAATEGVALVDGARQALTTSKGLRGEIGATLGTSYVGSPVLYMYWPSILEGYGGLPSEDLVDYAVLAKNNENIVEVALETGISLFLYDRLTGTNYPFSDGARNLFDHESLRLEQLEKWTNRAVLYRIVMPTVRSVISIDVSQPDFVGTNFSSIRVQDIQGDVHGLLRPEQYPFRSMESTRASARLATGETLDGSRILFFIAARMPTDSRLNINVTCGGSVFGELQILQPRTSGYVWWFNFHSIELETSGTQCESLDLWLETDAPGNVEIHKFQIFVLET